MTVYVVMHYTHEDRGRVVGVYSTADKAERAAALIEPDDKHRAVWVESFDVDTDDDTQEITLPPSREWEAYCQQEIVPLTEAK